jgi:two-component system, NarL family, sensor histidine kinase UhpB
VTLTRSGVSLRLVIEDNGRGFAVERTLSPESGKHGFGLVGIPERVRLLGGVYDIQSAPGQGTTISITLAIEDNEHER